MDKTIIEKPQSVDEASRDLFYKMYISNVQNRLRQLNDPTENDCKRWVWELIQNAKDSISNDSERRLVDIKIIIKDDEVKFQHNGSPFTAKALLGLLYKYSEGKTNNNESTGRFGTGFLTTHSLSKIVTVEGDVFTDNNSNSLCGFSATMFRDGIDEEELLAGVKKMDESLVYTKEINKWTTYTYHLKTPQNKKALQLGLENFISNIAQVMLFCEELKTVELDNKGEITKINRKELQLLQDDIFISEFEIVGKSTYTRRFIHKYLEKPSDELTARFKTNRNLRLMAAVEIDKDNNLVENVNSPSHYCVLPLIGSEKYIMPIYLNSPDFEPDSERESLLLIGEDLLSDRGVISEAGINRLILKESIQMFDSIVSYLVEKGYKKLYLLAKGLKHVPDFEKNFNRDWFKNEIMLPYRNVLIKYPIVETASHNQKLFNEDNTPNIIIPEGIEEVRKNIYSLAIDLFKDRLPFEEYAKEWAFLAWEECGLFGVEKLCEYVANKKNAKDLPSYEWINKFLSFIQLQENGKFLLEEYALVPNKNGDLVSLENQDFAQGIELTEFMLSILNDLGIDLNPILLNPNITAINLPLKFDAKNIAEKIDEQAEVIIKNKDLTGFEIVEKLLPLINISLTDSEKYSADFVEKQRNIFVFVRDIFDNLQISELQNNDLHEKAWNSTHKWLINNLLLDSVSEYNNLDSLPNQINDKVKWLNDFIAFVGNEIKEGKLDEVAIIPNQNGDFCFKKDLFLDDSIPEILKTEQAESFGIMLKNTLLHKEIYSVNISSIKGINAVIEIINDLFINNELYKNNELSINKPDKLDFAIYLIHLLPDQKSQILYNSQNSLLNIVRKYYYNRCKPYSENTIICDSEEFWRRANNTIIATLQEHISFDASLEELQKFLSDSGKNYDSGDTIIFLNDFYDYLDSMKIKIESSIIPNQNGKFCLLDDLYKDDDIPDELKKVLILVDAENDFRNILAEKSISMQPKQSKSISDIAKLIDEAVKEIFSDSRNWDDKNFKEAIAILSRYFKNHSDCKDSFGYSFNNKERIELNVIFTDEDREILKLIKENGIESYPSWLEKDAEIKKLIQEKEALLTENQELKEEKDKLEQEIFELKEKLKSSTDEKEINFYRNELLNKKNLLQEKTNEMAIISSCVNSGLSKQQQKEFNEEARKIVKKELENRLMVEQERQCAEGKQFAFSLTGFEGYSNSPIMEINGISYPIIVKSYKNQSEPFNINPIEWEQIINQPNSLFLVWDGNIINYIDILGLLKNQSHIDISFSTVNLDIEDRLNKFAQLMRYFKDIQFKFSSFNFSPFGQAQYLKNYFFAGKEEIDISDKNSDIML